MLNNHIDFLLKESQTHLQEQRRLADVTRIRREARATAEPAPWRSALAAGLRATADRLEPVCDT